MGVLDILYPKACVMCGRLLGRHERGVCGECMRELPYVSEPVCIHCGKPVAGGSEGICHDCGMAGESALDQGAALWVYEGQIKNAMQSFKNGGVSSDAGFYATELVTHLGNRIRKWRPDVIVPVPIHAKKEAFRGYNQADELCRELGRLTGIPHVRMLVRTKYTDPLKQLGPSARRKSLRQVFAINEEHTGFFSESGKRVLLADDIYTTGATINACADVLKAAGAESVFALCLCIGSER